MSDAHRHVFVIVNVLKRRYRCECGVLGYRNGPKVSPLTCRIELGPRNGKRFHCSQEAVFADGNNQHNRCAGHAVTHQPTTEGNL